MAQSDFASDDLIEVTAGMPRDWQPAQLLGSGILASLTCQLLVRFQTQEPLAFDVSPGPRTAMAREVGYWLVKRLEGVSEKLPKRVAANVPRRVCLSLQRDFARWFVLPKPRAADTESARSTIERETDDGPLRFEATRRVFKFEDESAPEHLLICHVLSQREHRTVDRLLVDFVTAVSKGHEPESIHCDDESGLCLWSSPSGHWAGKAYREIVIAPLDALPKGKSHSADTSTGHLALGGSTLDDVTPLHDIEVTDANSALQVDADTGIYDAFDEKLYRRSEADWEFVAGRIEEAHKAGRPLDDDFVETLARERLELAKTYRYSDRPDAGPTLDSSIGIVRSILNLHLTALRQYEAEEGS